MKIAIDCRMIGSGGIGSYVSELVPHFLENNECLLLGTHEQCMDFVRMANVEFCYCDVKPFSFEEMFSFPKEVLDKIHQYDFYFTPYCNIPGGIRIPVFSTIHDVVFLDVPGLTGFFGKLGRKFFYKRAARLSEEIFTVSQFSKERIIENLKCRKPISITYNAAPSYLRKNDDEEADEKESTEKDTVLFVGNIKKHKGLKTLLDAYEKSVADGFDKKLVIVGNAENFRTGDEETVARLKNLSEKMEGRIQFTGRITNRELKSWYKKSAFIVQPSLYEGFGMPPLEAMTVGTPAIVSDIDVFKEIYGDLPVTFFKAGDADDLAEKMAVFEPPKEIDLRKIEEKYSYRNSAETIINAMKRHQKD
ncbi:MAG: glycosyltransferase family 4 protein [Treponema sp.]|nr:glycosyltransferase family 4 protein [Treponema sp.]